MVYPDLRPTPQYEALGKTFGKLARLAPTLADLRVELASEASCEGDQGGDITSVFVHPKTGARYLMVVASHAGSALRRVPFVVGPHITGLPRAMRPSRIQGFWSPA